LSNENLDVDEQSQITKADLQDIISRSQAAQAEAAFRAHVAGDPDRPVERELEAGG
jgi:hypothetical protein